MIFISSHLISQGLLTATNWVAVCVVAGEVFAKG